MIKGVQDFHKGRYELLLMSYICEGADVSCSQGSKERYSDVKDLTKFRSLELGMQMRTHPITCPTPCCPEFVPSPNVEIRRFCPPVEIGITQFADNFESAVDVCQDRC